MRLLKIAFVAMLGLFGVAGIAASQTEQLPIPSGICTAANQLLAAVDANNVRCTATPSVTSMTVSAGMTVGTTLTAGTSVTVGSGAAITKISVYSSTVNPPSQAAQSCEEKAVTATGVTTSDKVYVNPPAISGSASVVAARVSTADTVALTFCNVAALSNQAAVGTYKIVAVRS